MLTIDEAIKHCEEVAKEQDKLCKRYDDASGYSRSHNENIRTVGAKGCEQLISLYRQIAEWLKELKAYRKAEKKILENMRAWEKIYAEPLEWNVDDINSIKLAFYQDGKADAYTDCIGICEIAFGEVAADGNSN